MPYYVGKFNGQDVKLNDLSSGNAHVVLWPDKPAYSPDDPITLTTFKSEPGGIAGLALTKIDKADFFQFILFGRYDDAGNWVLNSTVPPSLSGLDMSFRSFGALPTTGRIVRSPEVTLSFL